MIPVDSDCHCGLGRDEVSINIGEKIKSTDIEEAILAVRDILVHLPQITENAKQQFVSGIREYALLQDAESEKKPKLRSKL